MREKEVLPKVIAKYNSFLHEVYIYANSNDGVSLTGLIKEHEINKSVVNAMVNLAIIDKEADKQWNWLQDIPDRKLSMTVLNYLLERSKKSRAVIIPGMEEMNAVFRQLSETVTNYVTRREHALKQPQIPSNGNLFAEVDSKQDLINKAAFAIATGVYSINTDGLTELEIEKQNSGIVFAAKDLVNQLLK